MSAGTRALAVAGGVETPFGGNRASGFGRTKGYGRRPELPLRQVGDRADRVAGPSRRAPFGSSSR